MKYERLTRKADNGKPYFDGCLLCDLKSDCGLCPYWESGINRLAELEDKISQGTLIDLPCKVGDLIYFVSKKNGIQWTTINEIKIHIDFTGIVCIEVRDDDYKWHTVNNRTVFLTREEAKARLKEIQK